MLAHVTPPYIKWQVQKVKVLLIYPQYNSAYVFCTNQPLSLITLKN